MDKQYYHQDLKDLGNQYGIVLSKKRTNYLGDNVLSLN